MWARVVETMLGCWLCISPFIFRHDPALQSYWYNDLICGVLVIVFALASFAPRFEYAHLGVVAVALWLVARGYLVEPFPPSAALQNNVTVGWLLVMFGIIPNEANSPPKGWREL